MLVLVRHGRTEANARGRLLGRADPPLDDEGRAQAAAVARVVPTGARVVTSPLRRARETAAALGQVDEVDERWVELDYGQWDERPISSLDAATWDRWRNDIAFVPPGGESLLALGVRVRQACESLVARATDGDVVVVSHVSPIKAAVAWALGVDDAVTWRLHLSPGSVTRVAIRASGPVLLSFNEVAHLGTARGG